MPNRLIALLVGFVVGLGAVVSSGGFDAEAGRPELVRAHRHYVINAGGSKVYIGPNFCENLAADQGFAAFHHKVHVKDPGLVDVLSEPCNS